MPGTAAVAVKVAVTERSTPIGTSHAPVPEQAPLQRENCEPEAGVATRWTLCACTNWNAQVEPQLIPEGVLETVPVPVPARLIDSVRNGVFSARPNEV